MLELYCCIRYSVVGWTHVTRPLRTTAPSVQTTAIYLSGSSCLVATSFYYL